MDKIRIQIKYFKKKRQKKLDFVVKNDPLDYPAIIELVSVEPERSAFRKLNAQILIRSAPPVFFARLPTSFCYAKVTFKSFEINKFTNVLRLKHQSIKAY